MILSEQDDDQKKEKKSRPGTGGERGIVEERWDEDHRFAAEKAPHCFLLVHSSSILYALLCSTPVGKPRRLSGFGSPRRVAAGGFIDVGSQVPYMTSVPSK